MIFIRDAVPIATQTGQLRCQRHEHGLLLRFRGRCGKPAPGENPGLDPASHKGGVPDILAPASVSLDPVKNKSPGQCAALAAAELTHVSQPVEPMPGRSDLFYRV